MNLNRIFRWDRTITCCLYPLYKAAGQTPHSTNIPVLMYHSISHPKETRGYPYFATETSPRTFDAHMQFLHDEQYTVMRLVDLFNGDNRVSEHKKKVVITFDDGFDDNDNEAFPILEKFGFSATIFLPTHYIGSSGPGLEGKRHLSWNQVRKLGSKGIDFGSHTVDHPQLALLDRKSVVRQLDESKTTIEQKTGKPVNCFAYPYAFPENNSLFIAFFRESLRKAGYTRGVTTIIGRASLHDSMLSMKRLPVNEFDDTFFLKAKLMGVYDWMHVPQLMIKKIKNLITKRQYRMAGYGEKHRICFDNSG